MSGKRIGVFGGSFNPIHNGHLVLGKMVCDQLSLDQLIFMPAGCPPHKPHGALAPAEQRYAMALLAADVDPRFAVSRLELDAEGTTYTVNTMKTLRKSFNQEDALFFIMGADSLVDLVNWKSLRALAGLCTFAAAARPGIDRNAMVEQIHILERNVQAKVEIVEMPLTDISSSEIRRRVACKEDISSLVPEAVSSYIALNGLYGGLENDNQTT